MRRYNHSLRAACRAAAFLSLLVLFSCHRLIFNGIEVNRVLSVNADEEYSFIETVIEFRDDIDPPALIVPYIFGILYMFLALAIICDEYFVPCMEVISGESHLNLASDVAGATLMAAGGSAPELFTSLIGTFNESAIGFGTIVGSAVFNVLFVIGMCSLLSREVLTLSWWPLFRDSTYYSIGLLTLAIFVGVVSPGEIELWESITLFVMYIGYVIAMAYNETLRDFFSRGSRQSHGTTCTLKDNEQSTNRNQDTTSPMGRTEFKAGFLTLLLDPENWEMKTRMGLVSKIYGDAAEVFNTLDQNGDGTLCEKEFQTAMQNIEGNSLNRSSEEFSAVFNQIDKDRDGKVTKEQFMEYYTETSAIVKKKIEDQYKEVFSKNDNGELSQGGFEEIIKKVEPGIDNGKLIDIASTIFQQGREGISCQEFSEWYINSAYFEKRSEFAQKEAKQKSMLATLGPPNNAGFFGYAKWLVLLPIIATAALTIPDVRRQGMQKGLWCYLAFLLSIVWIGVYSYFMVGWAELVGNFVGIPPYIMGLTFLAAGTSVPDLLSSVIVARRGEGDMAVSSSIGSNIFDILVGLPLPWMIFTAWPNGKQSVMIATDGIWLSIIILLSMIVLIIGSIHLSGWKLSKKLGYIMFLFYVLFLIQAILDEYVW